MKPFGGHLVRAAIEKRDVTRIYAMHIVGPCYSRKRLGKLSRRADSRGTSAWSYRGARMAATGKDVLLRCVQGQDRPAAYHSGININDIADRVILVSGVPETSIGLSPVRRRTESPALIRRVN